MALVKLSVEEYISSFSISDSGIQELLALDPVLPDQCDEDDFIDPKHCDIGKNDLDVYLPMSNSSKGHTIDISDYLALNNDLLKAFEQVTYEDIQMSSKSNHVLLSGSVGVTMPKKLKDSSHRIEIVNALEPNYKPRYKSDYFSQDGNVRKPRYVADQLGNHYVTIKVVPGVQGAIRIDWVTILNEKNIRYSMPYKFQVNNDVLDASDSNPIYAPINADISGLIKLYLVLIKSKQDELKNVQSLEAFPEVFQTSDANNWKQMSLLTPKQLIQKYQLDKSQLAFTFCSLNPDGQTYMADWNTTVYSTILTEISTDTSKKRKITCPKCSHSFEIIMDIANDIGHEKVIKKRKK